MNRILISLFASLSIGFAANPELACDFSAYKAQDGLKAQMRAGVL